jgi:hypothetical protein
VTPTADRPADRSSSGGSGAPGADRPEDPADEPGIRPGRAEAAGPPDLPPPPEDRSPQRSVPETDERHDEQGDRDEQRDRPDHRPDDEVAELVGRLAGPEPIAGRERRRLLRRLADVLATSAARARASGVGGGRWLADVYLSVAPRVPIRDLATLQEHYYGLTGEALAEDLVRTAAKATTAVGAVGGALAAAQFAAPPLLLSAPAVLVAETLVVAIIETKLIAELHEVYGVQVPGTGTQRATAFAVAWSRQRGVDPLVPGSVTVALGTAAKTALRNRLMRTLGRHLTTLGPFLTGAVAGAALNRAATKRVAQAIRADLARQRGLPPLTR